MTMAARQWPWANILLIASLSFNLLVGGAVVTRYFLPEKVERFAGTSYLQIVPRKFLADLEKPRREELLGFLKPHRDQFRLGQQTARKSAENLADALAAQPDDEVQLRKVLDEFNRNGTAMIATSAAAAMDFIARLTPEERAMLATRIRDRATGGRKK